MEREIHGSELVDAEMHTEKSLRFSRLDYNERMKRTTKTNNMKKSEFLFVFAIMHRSLANAYDISSYG